MKGAKFVVLSLRDIIKNTIFILIGIVILVVLFLMFFPMPKDTESVQYNPGTYNSTLLLKGDPLEISITIDDNGIAEINTSSLSEKQLAYYPLVEPVFNTLAPQVIEAQSTSIDLSQDSYYTELVLLNAIDDALEQAIK